MTPKYITTVNVCGLDFDVTYNFYAGCPETYTNPADEPTVEILGVSVSNDKTADAGELLEAIKIGLTGSYTDKYGIQFSNGFDLLEQQILENSPT